MSVHTTEIIDVVYTPEYFHNFWNVLNSLRNENVRLVRYRYHRLPWTSLALLPPVGYCLSALQVGNCGMMRQDEWYRTQHNDETRKTIYKEFRDIGLLKKDIPDQWVGAYSGWSEFCRSGHGSELYISSMVMPTFIEDGAIGLLTCMNESMQEIGLFEMPKDGIYPDHAEVRAAPEEFPWHIMTNGLWFAVKENASERRELVSRMRRYLETAVHALENGNPVPYPMDVWSGNRLGFGFCCGASYRYRDIREFENELYICDAYRARLLRLLCRPEPWYMLMTVINRIKHHTAIYPITISLPYDIVGELEAYQTEVEQAYPWLTECPYNAVGISFDRPIHSL